MPDDSEFGTVLETIYQGDVIRTPEGKIVFVSSAFNPLTQDELWLVLVVVRMYDKNTRG
jgi:hypothetical protein